MWIHFLGGETVRYKLHCNTAAVYYVAPQPRRPRLESSLSAENCTSYFSNLTYNCEKFKSYETQ